MNQQRQDCPSCSLALVSANEMVVKTRSTHTLQVANIPSTSILSRSHDSRSQQFQEYKSYRIGPSLKAPWSAVLTLCCS